MSVAKGSAAEIALLHVLALGGQPAQAHEGGRAHGAAAARRPEANVRDSYADAKWRHTTNTARGKIDPMRRTVARRIAVHRLLADHVIVPADDMLAPAASCDSGLASS